MKRKTLIDNNTSKKEYWCHSDDEYDAIQKLGQIEDLAEELGISLDSTIELHKQYDEVKENLEVLTILKAKKVFIDAFDWAKCQVQYNNFVRFREYMLTEEEFEKVKSWYNSNDH